MFAGGPDLAAMRKMHSPKPAKVFFDVLRSATELLTDAGCAATDSHGVQVGKCRDLAPNASELTT